MGIRTNTVIFALYTQTGIPVTVTVESASASETETEGAMDNVICRKDAIESSKLTNLKQWHQLQVWLCNQVWLKNL